MPEPTVVIVVAGDGFQFRRPGVPQWTDGQQKRLVNLGRRLSAELAKIQKRDGRRTEVGRLAADTRTFLDGLQKFIALRGWEE